jgi:hypothetical protein
MSRWTLDVARSLMDHEGIGQLLNNMRWFVVGTSGTGLQLLTSDRPVLMSATLTERNAYLFLPIGPARLFVAVNDIATELLVRQRPLSELVAAANELISGHAIKYLYGQDDSHLEFAIRHMSTRRQSSLLERLAAYRKGFNNQQGRT